MLKFKAVVCAAMLIGVLLTACAPASSSPVGQQMPVTGANSNKPTQAMMATSSEMTAKTPDTMIETAPAGGMATEAAAMASTAKVMPGETPVGMIEGTPEAMSTQSSMMAASGWYGTALTNVADDKNFSLTDFKGKVVLVETMAIWCPTCLSQQGGSICAA
jgi:type IV secretory pathway VirB10-like protein